MRVVCILMAVLLISVNTELVEFGEKAVNEIFKEKRNSFILFTSSENTEAKEKFSQSAAEDIVNVYTIVDKDSSADHFKRFSEYLGIEVEPAPSLVYMI